jgi:hypothetical protein
MHVYMHIEGIHYRGDYYENNAEHRGYSDCTCIPVDWRPRKDFSRQIGTGGAHCSRKRKASREVGRHRKGSPNASPKEAEELI